LARPAAGLGVAPIRRRPRGGRACRRRGRSLGDSCGFHHSV